MFKLIHDATEQVLAGESLDEETVLKLARAEGTAVQALFLGASRIREHYFGTKVFLCSIINAKSGRCPENCSFCAQSSHHDTAAPVFPLLAPEALVEGARRAEAEGASCFGIVTSGTSISRGAELDSICAALRRIRKETNISPSCSLGIMDEDTARILKDAGMQTYHHNLETSRSFFPSICTTHDYEDDLDTIRAAKRAGLAVCSGGIFGLGESPAQRLELAFTLKELAVDSVPLNFLNPVPGTPLEGADYLTPLECLKTVALFRFILPDTRISVCGGREHNLRDLQSWIFHAGASGAMVGNYLTTSGRLLEKDIQMLKDLQLTQEYCHG